MSEFLIKLQSYDLFTLQARIFDKLLTFAHGIMIGENSPVLLKGKLVEDVTENDESLKSSVQAFYEFRKGDKIKNIVPETKFELLTFESFFPRILKTFSNFQYILNKNAFKSQIYMEFSKNLFLEKFNKFDFKYIIFSHKVARKK